MISFLDELRPFSILKGALPKREETKVETHFLDKFCYENWDGIEMKINWKPLEKESNFSKMKYIKDFEKNSLLISKIFEFLEM